MYFGPLSRDQPSFDPLVDPGATVIERRAIWALDHGLRDVDLPCDEAELRELLRHEPTIMARAVSPFETLRCCGYRLVWDSGEPVQLLPGLQPGG